MTPCVPVLTVAAVYDRLGYRTETSPAVIDRRYSKNKILVTKEYFLYVGSAAVTVISPPPFFEQCLKFGDDFEIFRTASGPFELNEAFQGNEAALHVEGC